ncbi:MAG: diaminopimelate decarboxylase [Actinomycetes bacterium]
MNFLPEVFSNNSAMIDGALVIGGCKASSLAQEFGTPLFVIDEGDFKSRINSWKSALNTNFGESAGEVYYASKSFISVEVAKWISEAGIGIDVCTGGELAVALAASFPANRIEVHGNNKSEEEIRIAIEVGVAKIVIDSIQEIERVDRLAKTAGKVVKVLLRITPGVEAHTHEAIATAHEDVKFGFSIASGAAWKAIITTQNASNLALEGLHCHIGSQIFENEGFILATKKLLELSAKFRDEFKSELSELDLGGGYGIAYLAGDKTFEPNKVMAALAELVKSECNRHNLKVPKISIEPGRAIAGPTTTTLYEVGTTKDVELDGGKTRRYIAVDGGMSDNIRPGLYGAKYSAILANRTSSSDPIDSRVVGKHCESGDIIIRDIDLPSDIAPGDILAIPATGAYGRSMASNYNHMLKPAVISVANGAARTILRRETEADLLALDVVEAPRTIK